mmetsp:Transcript_7074/g.15229  ORF Transcript_7074/g.15229 Transcript_7074/m.15229 type:complete len:245 (-) Transcript_7074:144-878(-)
MEAERLLSQRQLAYGHFLVLAAVFFPSFSLCLSLSYNEDVAFFVGRYARLALVLLPFLVAVPLLHLCMRPKRGTFFLGSVWIPAVILAWVGGTIRERTGIASASLVNRDCNAFPEKRALHRAHEVAEDVYKTCVAEGLMPNSIMDCPDYPTLEEDSRSQMDYLQGLEKRFPCAGICRPGMRLWSGAGSEAPACGMFVAQWLSGANTQASIILGYSVLSIILSIPAYTHIAKPLVTPYPKYESGA